MQVFMYDLAIKNCGSNYAIDGDDCVYTEDEGYVIQQGTGVLDDKGIEIFEGDVVNHGDNCPSEVKFGNAEGYMGFYLEELDKVEWDLYNRTHSFPNAYTNPIRIVGDIFNKPSRIFK